MAQKAVKKIGQYRLYKVEASGIYEIYCGTKETGVHVDNLFGKENFEWAVEQIESNIQQALKEEFGVSI